MPARLPFDRVATIYDETRGIPPKVLARILGVLADQLHGKRVLDIGVGTGRYAMPLQKSGVSVVGVDISRKMVDVGLAKGLRNTVLADGARLPFVGGSFDVAATMHVLHLVPDWRDLLLEVLRVTRDEFFTIIERTDATWGIKREYDEIVRAAGHGWEAPGIHERDLPDLLRPDFMLPVGPFQDVVLADGVLADLERRDYSSQWDVPEETHRAAMATLRERWAGREIHREIKVEIPFWRIERLAEVAIRARQRS